MECQQRDWCEHQHGRAGEQGTPVVREVEQDPRGRGVEARRVPRERGEYPCLNDGLGDERDGTKEKDIAVRARQSVANQRCENGEAHHAEREEPHGPSHVRVVLTKPLHDASARVVCIRCRSEADCRRDEQHAASERGSEQRLRVRHERILPALGGLCERRSAVMYARLLMSPPMLDGHAVDNSQGFDGFTAHARAVSPLAAPHEPALNGGRGGFRGQNGHIE